MNHQELATYLRTVHAIGPLDTYDPDIHYNVPAICFGTIYSDGSAERDGALPFMGDVEPDDTDSGLSEQAIEDLLRIRPSADRPNHPLGVVR